jgi:hypothetical protein
MTVDEAIVTLTDLSARGRGPKELQISVAGNQAPVLSVLVDIQPPLGVVTIILTDRSG